MISLIAAMSTNRVIGNGDKIPWHEPEDMKYFRKVTTGCAVIMGRKTFQSIGKVLPNRLNIVLTRTSVLGSAFKDLLYVTDIKSALEQADMHGYDKQMIIGGGEIYKMALDIVDRMYLTIVNKEVEGDVLFPEFDINQWKEIEKTESGNLTFKVLDRIRDN